MGSLKTDLLGKRIYRGSMNEDDFYDELVIPPELLELLEQEEPIREDEKVPTPVACPPKPGYVRGSIK